MMQLDILFQYEHGQSSCYVIIAYAVVQFFNLLMLRFSQDIRLAFDTRPMKAHISIGLFKNVFENKSERSVSFLSYIFCKEGRGATFALVMSYQLRW